MIKSVGFTGTRRGMNEKQKKLLRSFLERLKWHCKAREFHHGDCVGADEEAHEIARESSYYIVVHPPINPILRAFCEGNEVLDPKPYLVRNRDIVDSSDVLIACPYQEKEVLRSGTWATVRYARKRHKPIIIIFPSGRVKYESANKLSCLRSFSFHV